MTIRGQRRRGSEVEVPPDDQAKRTAGIARFLVAIARMVVLRQRGDAAGVEMDAQAAHAEQAAREACVGEGGGVRVVFAAGAAFVGGVPLRVASWAHECLAMLEVSMRQCGWSVLWLEGPIDAAESAAVARRIAAGPEETNAREWSTARAHLEPARTEALVSVTRDLAGDPSRLALAYGSALTALWEARSAMERGSFPSLPGLQRVAQLTVEIATARRVAFSQPTGRRLGGDACALGLDACLLAVSMMGCLTTERTLLREVALAAMLLPFAPFDERGAVRTSAGPPSVGRDRRVAVARTVAGRTTALWLGIRGLSESARNVVVLAYEAQLHRYRHLGDEAGTGAAPITVPARVIACAARFTALVAETDPRARPDLDGVLVTMEREAGDQEDRLVHRLLLATLGVLPAGTCVELSTREVGLVRSRAREEIPLEPRVQIVLDARGAPVSAEKIVDLGATPSAWEPSRCLVRVVSLGHSPSPPESEHAPGEGRNVRQEAKCGAPSGERSPSPPRRSSPPRRPSVTPMTLGPEILAGLGDPLADDDEDAG